MIVPPAPYIESMANFIPDFAIRSRSAKLSIAFKYGGRKSISSIAAAFSVFGTGLSRYDSIAAIIDGLPDPPYHALYFTPFHCAGLCDDVIMMPPAAPRPRTPKLSAGVGVMALAIATGMPVAAHNFGAGPRKRLRPEARVIADAKPLCRILLRVNISSNRRSGRAHIGKGKVVGDNAAPAVGTKLDLWMRHCLSLSSVNL